MSTAPPGRVARALGQLYVQVLIGMAAGIAVVRWDGDLDLDHARAVFAAA